MSRQKISNKLAQQTVRFRAICEDDKYRGPWRSQINLAYGDAIKHRSKGGNKNHVTRILTEHKTSIVFTE